MSAYDIATSAGADAMQAILKDPAGTLIALDFDGTLAPIIDDPDAASAHPGVLEALGRLGPVLTKVAILTGRPAETVLRLGGFAGVTGLEGMVILGQYGAERWDAPAGPTLAPPPPAGIAEVTAELPDVLAGLGLADLRIEHKSRSLVLHTRGRSDPEADLETLKAPIRELAERHGLIVEGGKSVLEIRSSEVDKGIALRRLQRETNARQIIFAGDDLGDLPAYDMVERLRRDGVPGLLVASASHEQDALVARSDLVLPGPPAVAQWLHWLAHSLDT